SLKTSIKTITYLSDIGCLEIQGASLPCQLISLVKQLLDRMNQLSLISINRLMTSSRRICS
ncbi:hypothetical protein, partial [Escherichia coli]|uniref:hypothetical protein n=1 Tax=Escherichia coli TaxID=562 RepID=UPI001BC8A372